jgi:hypothetical protein
VPVTFIRHHLKSNQTLHDTYHSQDRNNSWCRSRYPLFLPLPLGCRIHAILRFGRWNCRNKETRWVCDSQHSGIVPIRMKIRSCHVDKQFTGSYLQML